MRGFEIRSGDSVIWPGRLRARSRTDFAGARAASFLVAAFAASSLFLSGCGPTMMVPGFPSEPAEYRLPGDRTIEAPPDIIGVELSASERAWAHYLAGLMARIAGDNTRARAEMTRAVSLDPREPRLRLELASLFIRDGELRRALEHSLALKALEPDYPGHRILAAHLLVALQLHEDALEEYNGLLQAWPDDGETLVQVGSVYARLGLFAESVAVLDHAVSGNPESFLANLLLGRSLVGSGDYDRAVQVLRKAGKLNPASAELQLTKGLVHTRLGHRKKALDSFRQAADLNPALALGRPTLVGLTADEEVGRALEAYAELVDLQEDPLITLTKLGLVHFQRGDYPRAVMQFQIVLGARPGDDEIRFWLALSYEKLGDMQGAEQELRAVSPSAMRYADARIRLANIYQQGDRQDEAITVIEELVKHRPDALDAKRRLVSLYRDAGRFEEAIRAAEELVLAEPENDAYRYSVAWLYDQAGQRQRAISLLRQALELNPDNSAALNHLGYTFAEKGVNLEEAESLIRRALMVRPNDGAFVDSLGWVYFQQGNYERAVSELEKAMRLTGRDPVILEHLADAYVRTGRHLDAIRIYRDCEARSEDPEQKTRVRAHIVDLQRRVRSASMGTSGDTM